jgi:hypothetical protein
MDGSGRLPADPTFHYNTCYKYATKSVETRTSFSGRVIRVESHNDAAAGKHALRDRCFPTAGTPASAQKQLFNMLRVSGAIFS